MQSNKLLDVVSHISPIKVRCNLLSATNFFSLSLFLHVWIRLPIHILFFSRTLIISESLYLSLEFP
jgi:hypothetical protein